MQAKFNTSKCSGDLTSDEGFTTSGAFMVEEDTITGVNTIGFTVVDGNPVGIEFGYGIGASGIERCSLLLRYFLDLAIEFGGGSLIETGFLFKT